jgi:hypothetical protein
MSDFTGVHDVPEAVAVRQWALAAFALAVLATAAPLGAQSVSPPIAEHREKASASFVITNESVFPLTVTLQPRGFRVTEAGEVVVEALDTSRIHVSLSTLSFRLQPRQSYTVFYDAKADSVPAWFTIWSAITGARTASGVNIRIELPHVVYLNQKQRLKATDVRLTGVRWLRQQQQVVVELENTSAKLGRALEVTLTGEKVPPVRGAPFPSFPGSRRRSALPWPSTTPPSRVQVKFDGFTLESTDVVIDDTPTPPPAPVDTAPPIAPSDAAAQG